MKRVVHRRPEVSSDIIGLADFIARDSLDAALRFFDATETTISGLSEMPEKGSRRDFDDPALANLRSYAIAGFPNHLIFYEFNPQTLLVVAVLHGARDLPDALRGRRTT